MDSKLIRTRAALPKPSLLKDYLLDDLSSCSSNGFKSFPRRQCCTSVRFIHEFDLKNKQHQKKLLNSNKPPSKSPLSALRSVITAVKRLPFAAAAKSTENKSSKTMSFLPRSLSKKILKKSGFWKRKSDRKEIGGWKSFYHVVKEDFEPSDRSCSSDSKSNSWSGSDFTVSDECSSGNSSKGVNSNLPERTNDVVEMVMELVSDKGVGVTNDDVSKDSTTNSDDCCASTNSSTNTKEKQWSSDEKEQLSPVSVLDCPFDDDDQDREVSSSSSSFQHRLARMEGTKKKLMMKIQRFECLAKLEPVDLATRFTLQSDSDSESSGSPLPHSSPSIDNDTFISDTEEEEEEEEEIEAEDKAIELLYQMKVTNCNLKLNSEKLVLDFFRERIGIDGNGCDEEELVEQVANWIDEKQPRGMFLEWKVQRNRQAYFDDMEKGGQWKTSDQEKQDLAFDLETQVFDALLNEVLLQIE